VAQVINAPRATASEELLFVQRIAVSSVANARRIRQMTHQHGAGGPYPQYGLAQRLRQIAQLISADFGPRIYYTSLGDFDTHARQAAAHGPSLKELSDSIVAFFDDLKQRRLDNRVLLITFSEFGRHLNENGSHGTDHGVAAPMFLVGPACRTAFVEGAPPLTIS
jgi:uncharacterized protein (DUF1501 family)